MSWKILVVDDDPYLRDIYEETLHDAGFVVELVTDGEEGSVKLREGGYDLCLLDMMLPKMDGLGVLEAVTKNPPALKNGPIVIISNLSHESLIADALSKGAASYLVKADLTPDILLAEVKKYLPDEIPQSN